MYIYNTYKYALILTDIEICCISNGSDGNANDNDGTVAAANNGKKMFMSQHHALTHSLQLCA